MNFFHQREIFIFDIGLFVGVFGGIYIGTGHTLADLALIVTAGSVVYAAAAFYTQQSKDRTDAAIEQISFYRRIINRNSMKLFNEVRKQKGIGPDVQLPRIEDVSDFTLEWVRMHQKYAADEQMQPFVVNRDLTNQALDFINMLEEISVRIIHEKTIDHPAITAIRPGFVWYVEALMALIVTYKYQNTDVYTNIEILYSHWRTLVDRDDLAEKVRKSRENIALRKSQGEKLEW